MSGYRICNSHAVFRLGILLTVLISLVMPVSIPPAGAAAHLTDIGGVSGLLYGTCLTALPDINGDGKDELLVGAPGYQFSGADAGRVYLWYGGTELTEAPDETWHGVAPERFGWVVASIGDVNHDGEADWAVGAPLSNAGAAASGRVYVFYGDDPLPTTPDLTISGQAAGDWFGYSISAAGDFNGDGRDDFVVGAPYSNRRAADAGAAYIIYGAIGGPSDDLADAHVLTGQIANDNFGWSVSGAGNFLAGNEDCVAVGAPFNNTHGGMAAGAVYVFEGAVAPADPDTSIDFAAGASATAPGSQYGFEVRSAGRWNSDSYDDLAVGAPFSNVSAAEAGRIEIIYGGLNPDPTGDRYVNGQVAGDHFGHSLARLGDVSGSNSEDLAVGAPYSNGIASDAGRAYIYEGGRPSYGSAGSLILLESDPQVPDTAANDLYGFEVASAGDFDGDGTPDVTVGAPYGNIAANNSAAGFVHVLDSSGDVVPVFLTHWHAVWLDGDHCRLDFRMAEGSDSIVSIEIVRQSRTAIGQIAVAEVIWSGPAQGGEPVAGILNLGPDGYSLLDAVPAGWLATDWRLGYELNVTTASGQSIRVSELLGPESVPGGEVDPGRRMVELAPAWPNPFNPTTTVRFRAAAGQTVRCRVTDVRGREVAELYNGTSDGLWNTAIWNGRDAAGAPVSSGVYLIRLESDLDVRTRRVVLTK